MFSFTSSFMNNKLMPRICLSSMSRFECKSQLRFDIYLMFWICIYLRRNENYLGNYKWIVTSISALKISRLNYAIDWEMIWWMIIWLNILRKAYSRHLTIKISFNVFKIWNFEKYYCKQYYVFFFLDISLCMKYYIFVYVKFYLSHFYTRKNIFLYGKFYLLHLYTRKKIFLYLLWYFDTH